MRVVLLTAAARFSGGEALSQCMQGNVIESWLYTQAVMSPSVTNAQLSLSPLGLQPPMRLVLGAGFRS